MPRRPLPTRPLLLRVLAFALIGAAATVLIAWGSLAVPGKATDTGSNHRWLFESAPETPWRTSMARAWRTWGATQRSLVLFEPRPIDSRGTEMIMHPWSAVVAGWPMRALAGSCFDGKPQRDRLGSTGAIVPTRGVQSRGLLLPLRPLWPGFLVDTAFWGVAAFVVRSVPGFVRRRVRRRRGRCVRCGYELAGVATCPECGGAA